MSERPYSRHYHELVDDTKFAAVFPDDHHYATWSRLLMLADQAWPASAHIPASARRQSVQKLAEVGLIDLLPDGRFRMHGLQTERERRADSARNASAVRWGNADRNAQRNAGRNAGASVPLMPRRDETSRDETSRDETSRDEQDAGMPGDDGRHDLEAFLAVKYRIPTPKQRDFMDAYIRVFDVTGPERSARIIYAHPDDPIGALKADLSEHRAQRSSDMAAAEAEAARIAEDKRAPFVLRRLPEPEISDAEAERMADEWTAKHGKAAGA